MRREEYEQDATALMGAVDCGTGGRLQHVCGHGEDDAVSPPALLGVRAFRITQRGGKGLWCWGSSSLASSALVSCCGRPSLCNAATRGCVRDAVCPCLHAVLRELGWASCLQPAARVVLSPRHLGGGECASSLLPQTGPGA